jgi:hypothetical protein
MNQQANLREIEIDLRAIEGLDVRRDVVLSGLTRFGSGPADILATRTNRSVRGRCAMPRPPRVVLHLGSGTNVIARRRFS